MKTLWQDLRFGLRMLIKRSGFTAVAVITLALGIGANTAIFSLVDAVLLRPLPFAEPDRLMTIWQDASGNGFRRGNMAPANYVDIKNQNHVFEGVAALVWGTLSLTGDGEPEQADYHSVTPNLFLLLGVTPMLGRTFTGDDSIPGAVRTVVLSYGLWQRRFGGDPGIVGKDILVNNEKTVVVGVMPQSFQILGKGVDLWVPLNLSPQELAVRNPHYLEVIARLKAGITEGQAQAELDTISQGISRTYPKDAAGLRVVVEPMHHQLAGDAKPALLVLLAAVGCVLLIACVNLANLQLARGAARHREIAVRAALGASRWRLIRQLLTESVLLALLGGAAGILLARWSLTFLEQLVPESMSSFAAVTINPRLLGYALGLSVLTALLFGMAPALRTTRLNLSEALKQASGRTGLAAGDNRLRKALVVSEMALAMILLIAAGLLARTFVRLRSLDLGFRPDNVLVMRTALPNAKYSNRDRRAQFYQQVLDRVKALPGVSDVAYTTAAPLRWKGGSTGFTVEGHTQQADIGALHRQISPDYFRVMGIPRIAGRSFDDRDGPQSLPVAIINQTMARRFWPGEDPVGKRFKLGRPESDTPWLTVVGIAGDAKQMGIAAAAKAEMYFPYRQDPQAWCSPRELVIHAAPGQVRSLVPAVKAAIWEVDSQQPVSRIQTMGELIAQELGDQRAGTTLMVAFAILAVLLAAIGIYGVLSFAVTQRTQEIGIRMALGAERADILRGVMVEGTKLAVVGAGMGLATSLGLTRLMSSLLFGVGTHDLLTFLVSPALLLVVSLFASYIPARRATRVDPMIALRYE